MCALAINPIPILIDEDELPETSDAATVPDAQEEEQQEEEQPQTVPDISTPAEHLPVAGNHPTQIVPPRDEDQHQR